MSLNTFYPCALSLSSFGLAILAALLPPISPCARAAGLLASDGAPGDEFGFSVSISGNTGFVGAPFDSNIDRFHGSAYVFRNLNIASGTKLENAKLLASDANQYDYFGISVSISGNIGIVAAVGDDIASNIDQGSAYVFRYLNTVTGTVTEDAKLLASDGAPNDQFGASVSIFGEIGLIGSVYADVGSNTDQGAAYLFRNLRTATGIVTESAKLLASDAAAFDLFGLSVSISGDKGLVGAVYSDIGSNTDQGAAYLFRNLDTATDNVTENAKLVASDGRRDDGFGVSVSISGNIGLVGADSADIGSNTDQGAAYLFRNLQLASGTLNEDTKLVASDGATDDGFGISVSIFENTALVGASFADIRGNVNQGAAYVFQNLDTVSSTVTQKIKVFASDGAEGDWFGRRVAIDNDRFVIGAEAKNSSLGKAYSGHVRTFTTADVGSDTTATDGLSFISQEDWIVGSTTDNNTVTLSGSDTGNVTATGKGVYVGQNAGSDNNTLNISTAAALTANFVQVGTAGASGNNLNVNGKIQLTSGGSVAVEEGNILSGSGTIATGDVIVFGSVRPGNSIGMLTVDSGSVTWNASGDPWVFELGGASPDLLTASTSNTTQDLLMIDGGDFLKGSGFAFNFDFAGTGSLGWYKIVDWTGVTTFSASDFVGTNLAGGLSVSFTVDSLTSALYVHVIPEPDTLLLALLSLVGYAAVRRHRRASSTQAGLIT